MILYYGTDEAEALKISKDKCFKSKRFYSLGKGTVRLSYCYAPFYASDKAGMKRGKKLAMVKCSVEDTLIQLDDIGNAEVDAKNIEVLGVILFHAEAKGFLSDYLVICPLNFRMMGEYYRYVTEWIYQGDLSKPCMDLIDYEMEIRKREKDRIRFSTDTLYAAKIMHP